MVVDRGYAAKEGPESDDAVCGLAPAQQWESNSTLTAKPGGCNEKSREGDK